MSSAVAEEQAMVRFLIVRLETLLPMDRAVTPAVSLLFPVRELILSFSPKVIVFPLPTRTVSFEMMRVSERLASERTSTVLPSAARASASVL